MASSGITSGTILVLYVEGTAIAHSQNHSLNVTMSPRDATTKDSGGWVDNLEGVKSWSVDFSGLFATDAAYGASDLLALIIAGTAQSLKFTTNVSGDKYFHGEGLCTGLTIDSPTEENASLSGSFIGTGALAEATLT